MSRVIELMLTTPCRPTDIRCYRRCWAGDLTSRRTPSPLKAKVSIAKEIQSVAARWLEKQDIKDCAVLLTRSFLKTAESISGSGAKQFCEKAFLTPPRAVMLTAALNPFDRSELGPDREYRIAGVTHLSMSVDTRPVFASAQPPDDAAYISSMAVDSKYRRQGIARLLIEACEQMCIEKGVGVVTLHAWSDDEIAQRCYQSCGFSFSEKKKAVPFWVPTYRTRLLMQKDLPVV